MTKKLSYSELSKKLDDVLGELQSGLADIDRSLELYKQGQKIIDQLQLHLKTAENEVKKIKKTG